MPKEIFIEDVFKMRHDDPIPSIRARLKSIGGRTDGPSQFREGEKWSFEQGVLVDPDRPRDSIPVVFKDMPPIDSELEGMILLIECGKGGKGVKAYDDRVPPEQGEGYHRVIWITKSAIVTPEEERRTARDDRRGRDDDRHEEPAPRRRERAPEPEPVARRREPEPEPPARRRDPEPPARRREPEPEPEREREPEPRREEPPPREEERPEPAKMEKRQPPTFKFTLLRMALTMVACHRAARYAAKCIVEDERLTNHDYEGMPRSEFNNLRSSLIIKAFHDNWHHQLSWTKESDKPPVEGAPVQPPDQHPADDDLPF